MFLFDRIKKYNVTFRAYITRIQIIFKIQKKGRRKKNTRRVGCRYVLVLHVWCNVSVRSSRCAIKILHKGLWILNHLATDRYLYPALLLFRKIKIRIVINEAFNSSIVGKQLDFSHSQNWNVVIEISLPVEFPLHKFKKKNIVWFDKVNYCMSCHKFTLTET